MSLMQTPGPKPLENLQQYLSQLQILDLSNNVADLCANGTEAHWREKASNIFPSFKPWIFHRVYRHVGDTGTQKWRSLNISPASNLGPHKT